MKNIVVLSVVMALCLSGCAPSSNDEVAEVDNMAKTVNFNLDREFNNIIRDNPIDEAYGYFDEKVLNAALIPICLEYCSDWEKEIQYNITQLEEFLSESDHEALLLAYSTWSNYMETTFSLEQSLYYIGGEYFYQTQDGDIFPTGDGTTYPLVALKRAERTRSYAIDILNYTYSLTGTVDFVYDCEQQDTTDGEPENVTSPEPESTIVAKETLSHDGDETIYTVEFEIRIDSEITEGHLIIYRGETEIQRISSLYYGDPDERIEIIDINLDGYMDLDVSLRGLFHDKHQLYVWDTELEEFSEVVCDIGMLNYYEVYEGYIKHWGNGPELSVSLLKWEGNSLVLESETVLVMDEDGAWVVLEEE